jgi:hypothetical protein
VTRNTASNGLYSGGRIAKPAVIALLLLATATSARAVTPPTGDAAAIRYFKRQAAVYAHVPSVKIVETGYFFLRPSAHASVDYAWGSRPPEGYTPATATISARLADGKFVAYLAVLKAPGVRRLRIVMAGGTVFTSTRRCWTRAKPSASPLGTGERYLFNDGGAHFAPRAASSLIFTYAWTPGATATETVGYTARRPPSVDVSIKVAGAQSLSIHESIVPLKQAPPLPVPSPPALPRPKPICP